MRAPSKNFRLAVISLTSIIKKVNPDSITTAYSSNAFSNERILLQHVAKQDYVTKYSKDHFAYEPLAKISGGDDNTARKPRSQADDRANDVTNYYYNRNAFENHTFLGGMWNEPILMFRVTAIYDRGDADHATVTLDGHRLTLVHQCSAYTDLEDESDLDDNMKSTYDYLETEATNFNSAHNFIDGAQITPPTWRQAWQWW